MSDDLTLPAGERRAVRVFSLQIDAGGIRALRAPGALDAALGVEGLDPDHVEIFDLDDLDEMTLSEYLIEGQGVPAAALAADRARLDGLTGHVLLVLSRAARGKPITLHPAPQLHFVGRYDEPPTDWTATPLAAESARPRPAARLSPREARARSRRVGGIIFAVFMVAIAAILMMVLT